MYPYVVYWQKKNNHHRWKCFKTEDKAKRFQKSLLNNQAHIISYLGKDI